ncbi:DNA recombination protein RmuC [Oxyplasma meridianum]|uniref:DNA recombination protein RmuC n=1 Tax=Oxyplasma meridianum TaxID=3073602 RepID=A0AAX4NEQ5_9ARCH
MVDIEYLAIGMIAGIIIGFIIAFLIFGKLFSHNSERSRDAIKSIAADVIQSTFSTLTDQSKMQLESIANSTELKLETKKAEIEGIIKPLNDKLAQYWEQVNTMTGSVKTDYGTLKESIDQLMNAQKEMILAASDLNSALKNNQERGRWGEIQLRRIVEISGMSDHCDFSMQESMIEGDERVRPDMIVKLPGSRSIIVDAKTPVSQYIKALEASTEDERKELMKKYASQIRDTVRSLSGKSYHEKFPDSFEFVVMFIPGEAFFSAAIEADKDLIEYSVSKKVILASPLILISLLKSAAIGWQEYRIDRNREEIVLLGRELYKRIGKLLEVFSTLGKSLNKSVKDYNSLVSTLESRVLVTARKMSDLGVGDGKYLEPPDNIDLTASQPITIAENDGKSDSQGLNQENHS